MKVDIDRNGLAVVRARLEAAVRGITLEGLTFSVGACSFQPGANAVFKVEVAARGDGGVAMTREASAFKASARYIGMAPEDLGRSFTVGGRTYRIEGLVPRGSKVLTSCDGKRYKWDAAVVAAALRGGGPGKEPGLAALREAYLAYIDAEEAQYPVAQRENCARARAALGESRVGRVRRRWASKGGTSYYPGQHVLVIDRNLGEVTDAMGLELTVWAPGNTCPSAMGASDVEVVP